MTQATLELHITAGKIPTLESGLGFTNQFLDSLENNGIVGYDSITTCNKICDDAREQGISPYSFPDVLIKIIKEKEHNKVEFDFKGYEKNKQILINDISMECDCAKPKNQELTEINATIYNGDLETSTALIHALTRSVQTELEYAGIAEETAADLALCLSEIGGNAIKYGPGKETVEMGVMYSQTHIIAYTTEQVSKEYKGIDSKKTTKEQIEEKNIELEERGRGLFLTKNLAHEVKEIFDDDKRTTLMYWRLPDITPKNQEEKSFANAV